MTYRLHTVQLIQQWLAVGIKFRNIVIAQSHKVEDLSWSPVFSWNPEVGTDVSEGMDVLERRGQAGKEQNLPCPYIGF